MPETSSELTDIIVAEPVFDEDIAQPQGEACHSCGAPVEGEDRFCTACGGSIDSATASKGPIEAEVVAQRHFRCKNCGSEVATDPDQRSYTCPFCDSTFVVEFSPDETGRQRPEFVIGFRVTPDQAQEKFLEWLNANSWFRPGDLRTVKIAEKLRGIYTPFWSFSTLVQSSWSASIGEHWYRTESYTTMQNGKLVTKTRRVTETEWWPLTGRHHRYYSGYLVSGSRGLPQQQADRVKPYQLAALKRYQPDYLAGWLSEEYSVDRAAALDRCKREFYRREKSNVASFLPGDKHRQLDVSSTFSNVNSDLILLPVYLLSYQYGGKLYRFMINGQTGKISGDKPVSNKRIAAAVVGSIVAVLLVIGLIALLVGVFGR